MKNTNLIVNGVDVLSLYQKDCLFEKECKLTLVTGCDAKGNMHIKTQCTKCGYQTGGSVPKRLVQPTDKVKRFNQRLYNAVYKKKLEEVYGMSGDNTEINKRLQQMKKALKQGKLKPVKKRTQKAVQKN